MALQGFEQLQKQTQSLVLAPQLRQSLKILQAATLELRNVIQEELQTNPALEDLSQEGTSLESMTQEAEPERSSPDEPEELNFEKNQDLLNKLDEDWKEHFNQDNTYQPFTSEDARRRQHFFDSLVQETSLQEHLLEQAKVSGLDELQTRAMELLIGSLDERGFLTSSIPDISLMGQVPLGKVQEAHRVLQSFDPPGIGAEDLRDSLLTQLRLQGEKDSLASRIIRDQFKLFIRRRIPDLARKLGVDVEAIQKAIALIATLDPAPGKRFSEDTNQIIIPDVTIREDEGEWKVTLNDEFVPRLRINPGFKGLLSHKGLNGKDKDYLRDKLRSGRFLISSIEQRQQTIEKISYAILEFQKGFFEQGVSALRPLTMTVVADRVGVHETTVSRAISGKYMETPHGVFAMKYFFTTGYQSGHGEAVSNTTIKETIARIIEGEDTRKPYSDQEIVRILGEKGIKIARRTVAKYREEMGIVPTNLRRSYS